MKINAVVWQFSYKKRAESPTTHIPTKNKQMKRDGKKIKSFKTQLVIKANESLSGRALDAEGTQYNTHNKTQHSKTALGGQDVNKTA